METCNDILFRNKALVLVSGPSLSGKSNFVYEIIKQKFDVFEKAPHHILYCLNEESRDINRTIMEKFHGVRFVTGLDEMPQTFQPDTLIIFDDLLTNPSKKVNEKICDLISEYFIRKVHHTSEIVGVIMIVQNLFMNYASFRTIAQNANYLLIFRSPRANTQINVLANQLGYDKNILRSIFKEATKYPHSYLFIDLNANTDERLRFKSNVIINSTSVEPCTIVYKLT